MTFSIKLISVTPNAEETMAYCARVSSDNQENPKYSGLLRYCINHGHWSVFEMANMVIEVNTTRAISAQILRHRSFSFQEFSQRYQSLDEAGYEIYPARRQDTKNRQNSIDDMPEDIQEEWSRRQKEVWDKSFEHYQWALDNGIAKECSRFVLPMESKTKIYMNGTVRSWIHYLDLRCGHGTQKEHMEIAEAIKEIFCDLFPHVAKAKGWL